MRISVAAVITAAGMGLLAGRAEATQQEPSSRIQNPDAVLDHIDAAEDLVDALLDWRHVLSAVRPDSGQAIATGPANTLITIDVEPLKQLNAALDAIAGTLPARTDAGERRGDLRAHVEKAQEIVAEELLTGVADQRAIGTTGSTAPQATAPAQQQNATKMVTVDRTALQRLEIEIDAMERIAPRALH